MPLRRSPASEGDARRRLSAPLAGALGGKSSEKSTSSGCRSSGSALAVGVNAGFVVEEGSGVRVPLLVAAAFDGSETFGEDDIEVVGARETAGEAVRELVDDCETVAAAEKDVDWDSETVEDVVEVCVPVCVRVGVGVGVGVGVLVVDAMAVIEMVLVGDNEGKNIAVTENEVVADCEMVGVAEMDAVGDRETAVEAPRREDVGDRDTLGGPVVEGVEVNGTLGENVNVVAEDRDTVGNADVEAARLSEMVGVAEIMEAVGDSETVGAADVEAARLSEMVGVAEIMEAVGDSETVVEAPTEADKDSDMVGEAEKEPVGEALGGGVMLADGDGEGVGATMHAGGPPPAQDQLPSTALRTSAAGVPA